MHQALGSRDEGNDPVASENRESYNKMDNHENLNARESRSDNDPSPPKVTKRLAPCDGLKKQQVQELDAADLSEALFVLGRVNKLQDEFDTLLGVRKRDEAKEDDGKGRSRCRGCRARRGTKQPNGTEATESHPRKRVRFD